MFLLHNKTMFDIQLFKKFINMFSYLNSVCPKVISNKRVYRNICVRIFKFLLYILAINTVDLWNNELNMKDRYSLMDTTKVIYVGDNDLMRIVKNGYVVAWKLFSEAPGVLELYVLRRTQLTSK